ncbi:WGR domain-containing protein [Sinorhizobium meliloti]|nr:WGR domain-containing protein [Sinorhizobium meliloti]MDW9838099.1 WGR domain-containing protein [Sinorhizobium meliloti]MDX0042323.1 WGR domain-containing protein [Sinorhizobium meliloti]MDX0091568.1 WGR domain-containing protein [Sinorhizobium meliloti]
MAQHWFCLYVQRIDATKNMARYYTMSIEPNLFGGASLVRRWGRIGTRGKERVVLFKVSAHFHAPFLVDASAA